MVENFQYIPCIAFAVLFCANFARKKRWCCPSTIMLGYNFLALLGSCFIFYRPRSGFPYSNDEAMIFFAVAYVAFCFPLLCYKDGVVGDADLRVMPPVFRKGFYLAILFAVIPAAVFFSIKCFPVLTGFLNGGVDRETYRTGIDVSRTAGLSSIIFNCLATLSFCSLFCACFSAFFQGGKCFVWLVLGGFSLGISMLINVARSGIFEAGLFLFASILACWKYATQVQRTRIFRRVAVVMLILGIPFGAITVVRVMSPHSTEDSIAYSLISYFTTGPYSFNADYEAVNNYGTPGWYGTQTFFPIPIVRDFLSGTSTYEEGNMNFSDIWELGLPEYRKINDSYSGEFKTVVGCLMYDWTPWGALSICLAIALCGSVYFIKDKGGVRSLIFSSIYFYLVLFAPIGYGFVGRIRTLLLFNLCGLALFAKLICEQQRESEGI